MGRRESQNVRICSGERKRKRRRCIMTERVLNRKEKQLIESGRRENGRSRRERNSFGEGER